MTDEADFDGDFDSGDFDSSDVDSSDVDDFDSSMEDVQPDAFEDEFEGPSDSIPVEKTDGIYTSFRDRWGAGPAHQLQQKWGDSALLNHRVASAVMEDHPDLGAAINGHQTEGGVSLEGVQLAAQYLAEKSGFGDQENPIEALGQAHPEIEALFLENFDESSGTLSAFGVHVLLKHIGTTSGYKAAYRANR